MTILRAPPPCWKRPKLSDKAKLSLMFRRYGRHEFHHIEGKALWEREFDTEKNDTIPPSNDLAYLEAVTEAEHDKIENGPGGEKRITTAGSQTNRRTKQRNIRERQEEHVARIQAKLGMGVTTAPKRKSSWPKGRKLRSRGFERRRT